MAKSAASKAASILGKKGARARNRKFAKLPAEERTRQARAAANARWHPSPEQEQKAS
ncbi:MAG: hypothetical protein LAP40_16825 [Acidobacteriia bacterium]|nr:hypothetical protein [Terriglobia bacterium]